MKPDDAGQSLEMNFAIDKYVIPGYKNGIGKPTIIAQLIKAGFDKEYAVEVVDLYEFRPDRTPARPGLLQSEHGKPTRVDCPYCGAHSVDVTRKGDFAIWWFLLFTVYYLIYHFVFKAKGGDCSNCGRRLPTTLR